ncbi:hypothetical protein EV363DRAFT_601162 [Boletus edulis]|nr:hypothetical protein EV363DRAFT_601162 [Boletus edulis]
MRSSRALLLLFHASSPLSPPKIPGSPNSCLRQAVTKAALLQVQVFPAVPPRSPYEESPRSPSSTTLVLPRSTVITDNTSTTYTSKDTIPRLKSGTCSICDISPLASCMPFLGRNWWPW